MVTQNFQASSFEWLVKPKTDTAPVKILGIRPQIDGLWRIEPYGLGGWKITLADIRGQVESRPTLLFYVDIEGKVSDISFTDVRTDDETGTPIKVVFENLHSSRLPRRPSP